MASGLSLSERKEENCATPLKRLKELYSKPLPLGENTSLLLEGGRESCEEANIEDSEELMIGKEERKIGRKKK